MLIIFFDDLHGYNNYQEQDMAKKSREDKTFDDGLTSREQGRAYSEALLQMGAPKSKTPRRMAKILVWGFVILMPLSLLLSFVISDNNRSLNAELSKTLEAQYNPSFRVRYDTIGAEVVNAWYNKENPPINVDSSIKWNSTSTAQLAGASASPSTTTSATTASLKVSGVSFLRGSQIKTKGDPNRYEERLEYYALINGVPQIIGVTIAIPNLSDINSTPVLVSAPSVIGNPEVSVVSDGKSPSDALGAANVDGAKAVLNTWAKAWTEDDASSLKATTQDASKDTIYRGLGGGWAYVDGSAAVQWSGLAPDGGGNAVARVTWSMKTPDTVIPAVTGDNSKPAQVIPGAVQQQSMDVLIGKFDSGSPSILAWGQAGTYLELKPQRNALTKEQAAKIAPAGVAPTTGAGATVPSAVTVAPTPTATATPSNSK